jgi:hypothetical protein
MECRTEQLTGADVLLPFEQKQRVLAHDRPEAAVRRWPHTVGRRQENLADTPRISCQDHGSRGASGGVKVSPQRL